MKRRLGALCATMLALSGVGHAQAPVSTSASASPSLYGGLSSTQFERLLRDVEAGNTRALHAAAELLRKTDGATSESIEGAFSHGLQTNPSGVLQTIKDNDDLEVRMICEDRSIEPSASAATKFTLRASHALMQVSDPALAGLRSRCLAALHRSAKN